MEGLGKFIKTRINELNMTQAEFAAKLGVTPSLVSRWISGQAKPSIDSCFRMADVLQVNVIKIFQLLGHTSAYHTNLDTIQVKVLDAELPCGTPREYLDVEPEDIIEVPAEFIGANPHFSYFAVRARGNSMILKGIGDGYLVFFSPNIEVKHGDIGVVWINGGVCARIVLYRGENIIFQPANPAYEPIIVRREGDEYGIIGKVVAAQGDPNKVILDRFLEY